MDQNQQKLNFHSRIVGDFQFNKNKEEQYSNKQYIEYYNSSQNNQVVLSMKEFKRTKFIINQEKELQETNYQEGKENVLEKKNNKINQPIKLDRYYEDKNIDNQKSCLFCLSYQHLKRKCQKIKCPYCDDEHIKWKCKTEIKGKNKYSKTKELLTFKNEFGYDEFPRKDLIKCLKCKKYGHVNCSQSFDHYIKLKLNFDQDINKIIEQNQFYKAYKNNERINWNTKINYNNVLIDDYESSSNDNNYLNERISKKNKKQKNKKNNKDINEKILANKNLQLLYQQGNEMLEKEQRKKRNKDKQNHNNKINIKQYQEDMSDLDNSDIEMINQKLNEICKREIPKLLKSKKYSIKIIIEKEKKSTKVKNEQTKISKSIRRDNISYQNNFLQLQYNEQEDYKNKIKFYEKVKKFKYKNLHKLIRLQSAKKLTQNIFEKIHKDNRGNIFCIYSGQIVLKKQNTIQPFNKEHCLPRFFLKTPINHYDNNILILVPVITDYNSMRANKPYFCPTEMSNDKCECHNQTHYKRRYELECKVKKFEYGQLLENYYENTIQQSSKEIFNKQLPHVHELYERNEAGHFYMGKQSFFCSNKNKGGIARICLYALLKYRKSFKKEYYDSLQIDFLKYLSKKYKVEEWEKKKNYFAEKYQGDRNPFVDHPGLVDKIDFTKAFIQ